MLKLDRRTVARLFFSFFTAAKLKAIEANERLPHFTARTLDGERFTTDSVKGKVLLLDFWATWCPPCKSEEPVIEKIVKDFSKDSLIVLAVNMGEPRRRVKRYLETSPRSSKVVLAEETTLAAICDARSYPLYVMLIAMGRSRVSREVLPENQPSGAFWQGPASKHRRTGSVT